MEKMQQSKNIKPKSQFLLGGPIEESVEEEDVKQAEPQTFLMVDELSPCEEKRAITSPNKIEIKQNLSDLNNNIQIEDFSERIKIPEPISSGVHKFRHMAHLSLFNRNKVNTDPY